MVFITILLFTVAYIFAVIGVIFFESYTSSDRTDLIYKKSFRLVLILQIYPCSVCVCVCVCVWCIMCICVFVLCVYVYCLYEVSLLSSLPNALITLFQLFTLDQWYKIYNDIIRVQNKVFTCTYILLWVWVGAFVFRNLFVGIMGKCDSV